MKLISYDFGQALQLIRMDEVRSFSGVYIPDLIRSIRERYRFIVSPDWNQQPPSDGLKFETGVFFADGRQISIKSFGIYNDGLLVACWNTDDADAIVDEFTQWSAGAFGLRPPLTRIRRKHASNVVVDFDVSMDEFILEFNKIAHAFEAMLETDQGTKIDTHVYRLTIGADPQPGVPSTQTTLLLEQRASSGFSDRRYYSGAPLRSSAHIKLLLEIENIVVTRTKTPLLAT